MNSASVHTLCRKLLHSVYKLSFASSQPLMARSGEAPMVSHAVVL